MRTLPLLFLCGFLLVVQGSPPDRAFKYYRTREEQIDHARKHRPLSSEEFKQLVKDDPLAEDMARTSEFLQKLSNNGGLGEEPPISEKDRQIATKMSKLMESRVEIVPSIDEVNEQIADHLYEGDIVLSASDIARMEKEMAESRNKRAVLYKEFALWPKNETIYYGYADNDYSDKEKAWFRNQLSLVNENTCLTTAEKNEGHRNVMFYRGSGCAGRLGYEGPNATNLVSIGNRCETAILHEFFHVLTLGHTVRRNDRDDFLTVQFDAIHNYSWGDGFAKLYPHHEFHLDPPVSYDYRSLMHYGVFDMSINGSATMIPHESDYVTSMGNRLVAPFSDWKQINMRYKCGEECPTKVQCENGGYPHPRRCNECTCTDFYSGARCEKYDGFTLKMGETQDIAHAGPRNNTLYDLHRSTSDYKLFTKLKPVAVMGPVGKRLRVTLTKISVWADYRPCMQNCHSAGVEIIDYKGGDLTMGGKLFCCDDRTGYSFITNSNIIGFRGWAAPGWDYDFKVKVEVFNDNVFHYGFDSPYTDAEKTWFRNQLADISENTCLKFVEKTDGTRQVLFRRGNGTGSLVQWMFDYSSSSSPAGQPLVVLHNADFATATGKRLWPTFADYKQINAHFKCGEQCRQPVKCENGGYPHPSICGKCVCHDFANGERCQTLAVLAKMETGPDAQGVTVWTDERARPFDEDRINNGTWITMNLPEYSQIRPKLIMSPLGTRMLVYIQEYILPADQCAVQCTLPEEQCATNCRHTAFEYIDNEDGDMTREGKLLCCNQRNGHSFVSKSNVVGLRGHAAKGTKVQLQVSFRMYENANPPNPVWALPDGTPIN